MISLESPFEIQDELDRLQYEHIPQQDLKSAQETMRRGKANCFEAAILAAYLNQQFDHPSLILDLTTDKTGSDGKRTGHSVHYFVEGGKYYSVGFSRFDETRSRFQGFDSVRELAESYREAFQDKGYNLAQWGVFLLDNPAPQGNVQVDWRSSKTNIRELTNQMDRAVRYKPLS